MMTDSPLTDWKSKYLASVKEVFQHIEEHGSHLGKNVGLERGYPNLRVVRVPKEEPDVIPFSGTLLEQVEITKPSDRYFPSSVQDLFVPDGSSFVPKTVVLLGPNGIGKTTTSQKIMLDWASGKLYADRFDFVFYLSARAINKIDGDVDIGGLVARSSKLDCPGNLIKSAFNDPAKVLLLLDGFDELKWTLENDYEDHDDPFQETHKETLLRCLLEKEILSETSLLITTRSMFLQKMRDFAQSPCSVELLGFSEEDLQPYFQGFFKDKDQADQAVSVLKGNEVLLDLCSVPLTCWLVGSILKAGMKSDLGSASCKTITAVYLLYLRSLLKKRGDLRCLKKLCELANEGLLNQNSLFDEEDLGRHGLSASEVASAFPNGVLFRKDPEASSHFSFLHLSFQEFFAALYYVLGEDAEVREANGARGDSFLPKVCKGKSLVYQAEHHPYLSSAVRFLFGLLNEKRLKEFADGLGSGASLRAKPAAERWLTADRNGFCVQALACFYEAQDEELRAGAFGAQDLAFQPCLSALAMEDVPVREMLYCLAGRESFGSISLEDHLMRPKDLELLAPFFHSSSKLVFTRCGFAEDIRTGANASWLSNPESKIQELEFRVCVVAPSFFGDLRSLIASSKWLTKLTVSHHILEDSALETVCDGLQQPSCILQELTLDDCNLGITSCEILGAAIGANRSLHKLDLALNRIEDEGVKFLCEGLKDPGCPMQELRMEFSEVTSGCCEYLRSVLMGNRNLTTLYIRDCKLQDEGVKLLCEALREPGCTLRKLGLYENSLSVSACEDLRSVLLTNRSLTSLDLTYNQLTDSGAKLLCEGLRVPGCTVQELILSHCELSSASCQDLRSVLSAPSSLTHLTLTWNSLQDSGAHVLCQGLRHPKCSLKKLRLNGCDLSSSSLEEFASVILTNRSLTVLDLSGNSFKDEGVRAMCEALRTPGCTLQEFRMGYCEMTDCCAEELSALIGSGLSLAALQVSFAYEDVAPPPDLDEKCRKLELPSCTLERNDTQDGLFIYFKYKKQN